MAQSPMLRHTFLHTLHAMLEYHTPHVTFLIRLTSLVRREFVRGL